MNFKVHLMGDYCIEDFFDLVSKYFLIDNYSFDKVNEIYFHRVPF